MDPGNQFAFGTHPQHGFVAAFTSSVPAHLADWFLTRERFEPVPDTPGLFRLTEPEHDGARRTRQAVQDLRRLGFAVQADFALDLAPTARPPRPAPANGLMQRRSRIAQAAAGRSSQRRLAPTAVVPSARPIPPKPAYAPTVHLTASATGRSR
ncbi:hypothetical protein RKD23_001108 [Streptomyces sp. SAI-170]|uniref:hypothetical protein n=1 Tax=Streptomyces sp. SAI-170 TaxID=3377729 RepID=UPI003C7998EC